MPSAARPAANVTACCMHISQLSGHVSPCTHSGTTRWLLVHQQLDSRPTAEGSKCLTAINLHPVTVTDRQ